MARHLYDFWTNEEWRHRSEQWDMVAERADDAAARQSLKKLAADARNTAHALSSHQRRARGALLFNAE